MADDLLPDDVKAFLLRRIDSIARLAALLLLRANGEEGQRRVPALSPCVTTRDGGEVPQQHR